MVCGHCGSRLCGVTRYGKREYICRGYLARGRAFCYRDAIAERPMLDFLIRTLQNAYLNPDNLAQLRREVADQEARERGDGNLRRLRRRADELGQKIARGNERLVLLPADRIPGVVEQLRGWEREREATLAELAELEADPPSARLERAVADAEAALWRLREALRDEGAPLLRDVLRQMVNRIELRWDHEQRGSKVFCRVSGGVVWMPSPEGQSQLYPSAGR